LNRRQNAPLIAQLLAIALLAGGLPMAASPVIVQHHPGPAFTLDICTPLPSFALGAASCSLAPLPAFSFRVVIEDHGIAIDSESSQASRALDAPDPPPPKFAI
jgi:hypothetical protein